MAARKIELDCLAISETRAQAIELGLNCSICFGLLQAPVETACGHLFCSRCLPASCKACPLCRAPLESSSGRRLVGEPSQAMLRLMFGLKARRTRGNANKQFADETTIQSYVVEEEPNELGSFRLLPAGALPA